MFVKISSAVLCLLAAATAAPKEQVADSTDIEDANNNLIARQINPAHSSPVVFNPAHQRPTINGIPPPPPPFQPDGGLARNTMWTISNIYVGCGAPGAPVGCSVQFDIDSQESVDVPGVHATCFSNRLPNPLIRPAWRPCQIQQVDDTQGANVRGLWTAVTLNPRTNQGNILVGMSFQGQDQFGRFATRFWTGAQAAPYRFLSQRATSFNIFPDDVNNN